MCKIMIQLIGAKWKLLFCCRFGLFFVVGTLFPDIFLLGISFSFFAWFFLSSGFLRRGNFFLNYFWVWFFHSWLFLHRLHIIIGILRSKKGLLNLELRFCWTFSHLVVIKVKFVIRIDNLSLGSWVGLFWWTFYGRTASYQTVEVVGVPLK